MKLVVGRVGVVAPGVLLAASVVTLLAGCGGGGGPGTSSSFARTYFGT